MLVENDDRTPDNEDLAREVVPPQAPHFDHEPIDLWGSFDLPMLPHGLLPPVIGLRLRPGRPGLLPATWEGGLIGQVCPHCPSRAWRSGLLRIRPGQITRKGIVQNHLTAALEDMEAILGASRTPC